MVRLGQILSRHIIFALPFGKANHREILGLGRPDHVQLIFDRRVTKRTPGRFRTRVHHSSVVPALYCRLQVVCVSSSITRKGAALRTETTINNTRDFAIGKRLINFLHCARSAFPGQCIDLLLDVQITQPRLHHRSKWLFNGSTNRLTLMDNELPHCVSLIQLSRGYAQSPFDVRSAAQRVSQS